MAEAALKVAAQPIQINQQQPPVFRADECDQEARSRVPYKEISSTQAWRVNRIKFEAEDLERRTQDIDRARRQGGLNPEDTRDLRQEVDVLRSEANQLRTLAAQILLEQ